MIGTFPAPNSRSRSAIAFTYRPSSSTVSSAILTRPQSTNPGLPPVEKCLLCHNVIATKFEPISRIHEYYNAGKPIPWVRVSGVPDFVHFSHQSHLAKGIDCGALPRRCRANGPREESLRS